MGEFNLVPEEFTQRENKRSALKVGGTVIGGVVGLCLAAFVFTETLVAAQEVEVGQLREHQAISMQQRDKLTNLQRQKEKLQTDMLLLSSLRSGTTMPQLVQAIEAAIPDGDVRFESWLFRRAGIRTEDEPEARPPSYFFIKADGGAFPKAWESMTHMTIQGEAKDHSALSRFVQRLFSQPNIDDVRIQRSSQSESGVSFHLAVVVRSEEGESS